MARRKTREYVQDPTVALANILVSTYDSVEQFVNNPESLVAKGVLDACLEHNKLLLKKTGII